MVDLHPGIQVRNEKARGCGFRQKGGTYLVSGSPAGICRKLPVPLDRLNVCPHCGGELDVDFGGLKQSRAPRMLQFPEKLWIGLPCENSNQSESGECKNCPLSNGYEMGPALLIWIGETHYPTPQDFLKESGEMGISRRIPAIPKGFKIGETWVLLAHTKAVPYPIYEEPDGQMRMESRLGYKPGVFSIFRPRQIERIVDGTESPEEIEALIKRGLTPVFVNRIGEGSEETSEDQEHTQEIDNE